MLCLAWSSKALGSFPRTEIKMNHNFKKKKKSAMAAGLRRATGILGLPALPAVSRAYGAKGAPMSAVPSICHTWTPKHLPRPNSAQAPTPRPFEGRGGAAHRNRFSARPVPQAGGGVLGGQAGRLGAGPQGARPGGDSRPKHQGPGASGAPWTAPSLSSFKP